MAAVTVVLVDCSEAAIRVALTEHGVPGDVERFETELRAAGGGGVADRVLRRWQGRATIAANQLEHGRAGAARADRGTEAGQHRPRRR